MNVSILAPLLTETLDLSQSHQVIHNKPRYLPTGDHRQKQMKQVTVLIEEVYCVQNVHLLQRVSMHKNFIKLIWSIQGIMREAVFDVLNIIHDVIFHVLITALNQSLL